VEIRLDYPTWFEFANNWLRHALNAGDRLPASAGPMRSWFSISTDMPIAFVMVTWIVCILMIIFAYFAGRNLQRNPGWFQNLVEMMVSGGDNFVRSVVGPDGSTYTPFILTLWLFIFLGSFIGIVPGFVSPTANINTTVALAIIAFLYVNYVSVRKVGLASVVKGFFPPPLWMAPFVGCIEIISHIIRPLTLAVRLFGNIFGEDVVIAVLAGFGLLAMAWTKVVPIPVQFPMMFFSVFTDIVQASIFCMLTTIYIALLTGHGHGPDHGSDHGGDHGHDHGHDHGSGEHAAAAIADGRVGTNGRAAARAAH
jgi:F-type H+-transporting ATPase subunit a